MIDNPKYWVPKWALEACEDRNSKLLAIENAARLLIADVRERHPEQELYCPFMRALDKALKERLT